MKQVKTSLLMFALVLISVLKLSAQAPPPPLYRTVPMGPQSIIDTVNSGDKWYQWFASGDLANVGLKMLSQGDHYTLSRAELYTVVGGFLSLQFSDTLQADSTMNFYAGPLGTGQNVYLRIVNITNSCGSCAIPPIVRLRFKDIAINCNPAVPCDIVRNGGFEFKDSGNPQAGPSIEAVVDCWQNYEHTPDVFTRGFSGPPYGFNLGSNTYNMNPTLDSHNGSPNNTIAGFICEKYWNETTQSIMNQALVPGSKYVLSFWGYNYVGPITINSNFPNTPVNQNQHPTNFAFATYSNITGSLGYMPTGLNLLQNFVFNQPPNTWKKFTSTFTYSGPPNQNVLFAGPNYIANDAAGYINSTGYRLYVGIDDVSLQRVYQGTPFSIPGAFCTHAVIPNLAQYVTTPGGTFSGPGVVQNGSQYDFNSNIAGLGIHTIVYTYTNASGCLTESTGTVQIGGNQLSVTASYPSACGATTGTYTASGGSSYTWNTGFSGNPLVLNPIVPGFYTVASGLCTGTVQAIIPGAIKPCVNMHTAGTGFTVQPGPAHVLAAGTYFNYKVTCYADLIIPDSAIVNFNNCTFMMAPGTKIRLGHGSGLSSRISHFYGCSGMWDGFWMPGQIGATLAMAGCMIEDAQTAITVLAAGSATDMLVRYNELRITTSIFNKNGRDITYYNSNRNKIQLANNIYTSRCLPYDPPLIPVPVFTPSFTTTLASYPFVQPLNSTVGVPNIGPECGVYLDEYLNMPGDGSRIDFITFSNGQIFDSHQTAIRTLNFNNLKIIQQIITNGKSVSSPTATTYGILMTNSNENSGLATPASGSVVIGGSSTEGNTMSNVDYGLYVTAPNRSEISSIVSSNKFSSIKKNAVHYSGVWSSSNLPVNQHIRYNTFQNVNGYAVYLYNSGLTNSWVSGNTITNTPVASNTIEYKGFYFGEMIPSANAKYAADGNTLTNVVYGITGENVYNTKVFNNQIGLTSRMATGLNDIPTPTGVMFKNSTTPSVMTNTMTAVSSTLGIFSIDRGISGADCSHGTYQCNRINNTLIGAHFAGQNIGSAVYKNFFTTNSIGISLTNNGFIDVQDNPALAGQPSDNQFLSYASGTYHSYAATNGTVLTNGPGSPFYVRNVTNFIMPNNGNDVGSSFMTPVIVSNPSPYVNDCNGGSGQQQLRLSESSDDIASNPGLFDPSFVRENLTAKQQLYSMVVDSMTNAPSSNVDNFIINEQSGVIGKIDKVNSEIEIYNTGAPNALNDAQLANQFIANNNVESNQKVFNELYLNFLRNGTLSDKEVEELSELAVLCPYVDGTSIWQARTLLRQFDETEYMNECEIINLPRGASSARMAMNSENSVTESTEFIVMPNPNAGEFSVLFVQEQGSLKAEVYDLSGRLVYEQANHYTSALMLDCKKLESGIYLVKVFMNGRHSGTKRMVISK